MGSLRDLYIQGPGHPVTDAGWGPATDLHEEIVSAIHADATALITLIAPDGMNGMNSPDKKAR
jgi:hypothetical protein